MLCDKDFWRSKTGMALIGALLLGGGYLLIEHTQHLWAFLPYAFVLACPLMHLFMHHGLGGHAGHDDQAPQAAEPAVMKAVTEASHDT